MRVRFVMLVFSSDLPKILPPPPGKRREKWIYYTRSLLHFEPYKLEREREGERRRQRQVEEKRGDGCVKRRKREIIVNVSSIYTNSFYIFYCNFFQSCVEVIIIIVIIILRDTIFFSQLYNFPR